MQVSSMRDTRATSGGGQLAAHPDVDLCDGCVGRAGEDHARVQVEGFPGGIKVVSVVPLDSSCCRSSDIVSR